MCTKKCERNKGWVDLETSLVGRVLERDGVLDHILNQVEDGTSASTG